MSLLEILNSVVQILAYIFLILFVLVSLLKIIRGTKAETLSVKSIIKTIFSAFITSGLLLWLAGWRYDWLVFGCIILAIVIGVSIALFTKDLDHDARTLTVKGKNIGSILWIISVIIAEYLLINFSKSSALQASYVFGFCLVVSMNFVYVLRIFKHTKEKVIDLS